MHSYWQVEVGKRYPPGQLHVIWPDGCVSLSVTTGPRGPSVRAVGPRSQALRVPLYPGLVIRGMRFWPDAGGRALRTPARALRNHTGDAAEFLGEAAAKLLARVTECGPTDDIVTSFDAWAAEQLAGAAPVDHAVRGAVDSLIRSDGRKAIAAVAGEVELGLRQLQRRFGDAVGLTPKQFARIRRMRGVLAKLLETPRERWSLIAAELGYADQAHLVRDVAKLTGLTPTMVAERMERIAHRNVRP